MTLDVLAAFGARVEAGARTRAGSGSPAGQALPPGGAGGGRGLVRGGLPAGGRGRGRRSDRGRAGPRLPPGRPGRPGGPGRRRRPDGVGGTAPCGWAGPTCAAFQFDATDCPGPVPAPGGPGLPRPGHQPHRRGGPAGSRRRATAARPWWPELSALGARLQVRDGCMEITGGPLAGGVVDPHNDHRMAMACAVAGLDSRYGVTMEGEACVAKSYPRLLPGPGIHPRCDMNSFGRMFRLAILGRVPRALRGHPPGRVPGGAAPGRRRTSAPTWSAAGAAAPRAPPPAGRTTGPSSRAGSTRAAPPARRS